MSSNIIYPRRKKERGTHATNETYSLLSSRSSSRLLQLPHQEVQTLLNYVLPPVSPLLRPWATVKIESMTRSLRSSGFNLNSDLLQSLCEPPRLRRWYKSIEFRNCEEDGWVGPRRDGRKEVVRGELATSLECWRERGREDVGDDGRGYHDLRGMKKEEGVSSECGVRSRQGKRRRQ